MDNCPDTDIDPISLSAVHIYNFHIFTVIYKGLVIILVLVAVGILIAYLVTRNTNKAKKGPAKEITGNYKCCIIFIFRS